MKKHWKTTSLLFIISSVVLLLTGSCKHAKNAASSPVMQPSDAVEYPPPATEPGTDAQKHALDSLRDLRNQPK